MEAVILAGGKGTRLKPYTVTLPKPLVPVGERPILEIVLAQLKEAGFKKVTLAVNHMADIIMAFFGSGEKFGIEINYSLEHKPLGTVAPVKLISGLPENFLVMNGDVLTDIDYRALFESHVNNGSRLTVATYHRDVKIDFGVLDVEGSSSRVVGFREKPTYHLDVSMGIYVFNRMLLERVPAGEFYGFDDLVLDMLRDGETINAFPFLGYWLDIGRPDDYEIANNDIDSIFKR